MSNKPGKVVVSSVHICRFTFAFSRFISAVSRLTFDVSHLTFSINKILLIYNKLLLAQKNDRTTTLKNNWNPR